MATLEIHPDDRALLEASGLATFDALYAAGERGRFDGHRARSVSRLPLGEGPGRQVVIYLKRQWGSAAARPWRDLLRLRWPELPARREWNNVRKLLREGIATARPVAWGWSREGGPARSLVAFRAVEGPSLAAWLADPQARAAWTPRARRAVAEMIGRTVRQIHEAGLSFPDLYAKHLFIEDIATSVPRVVLIDAHRLRWFLPWRAARDLAALLVTTRSAAVRRTDRLRVLRAYLGGPRIGRRGRRLIRRIETCAARMAGRGQDPHLAAARRRAMPGGAALADEKMVVADGGRLLVNAALKPVLEAAGLSTLDALMNLEGGRAYRVVPGRATVRVELADPVGGKRAFYVKRFTRVPLRTQLRRLLALVPPESFAREEFRGIVRLADAGIPSVRPVAVGEKFSWRGLREQSCIVTEEVPGATQADTYFQANFAQVLTKEALRAKRKRIIALAHLARRMHGAGLAHRDFYLCHILVRPMAGGEPALHLIDLQRLLLRRHGLPKRWIVKDLAAMLFSSWPSPATMIRSRVFTQTDRLRFARAYFDAAHLASDQKRLLRRVVAKARRIARHETRRRARKESDA